MIKIYGKPFHLTKHSFSSLESQMYILNQCFHNYLSFELSIPHANYDPVPQASVLFSIPERTNIPS